VLGAWEIFRNTRRVYRSRSSLIAGAVWLVIANVFAVGTIAQDPSSSSLVLVAALYGLVATAICCRLMWSGIFVLDDGIHVANIFTSFDADWDEIERIEIGRWKIARQTCLVHTRDGRVRPALGIQESTNFPNGSAERLIQELNQERETQPMKRRSAGFPDGMDSGVRG
jgi:hypothetical protein